METHENISKDSSSVCSLKMSLYDLDYFNLSCNICSGAMSKDTKMIEHSYRHKKGTSLPCVVCPESFMDTTSLHQHYDRDHLKPFTCEECGNSFRQRNLLRDHFFKHSDDRLYSCKTCSRNFKLYKSLKDHAKKHYENKPYRCGVCGKTHHDDMKCPVGRKAYFELLKKETRLKNISNSAPYIANFEAHVSSPSLASKTGSTNESQAVTNEVLCDNSELSNNHWTSQACSLSNMDSISGNHPLEVMEERDFNEELKRKLDDLDQTSIYDCSIQDPQSSKDGNSEIEHLSFFSEQRCEGSERSGEITFVQPSVGSSQTTTDISSIDTESDSANDTVPIDEEVFGRSFPPGYAICFEDLDGIQ